MTALRRDLDAGGAFMRLAMFKFILDQCRHARQVHLRGLGEPLLHP